MRPDKDIEEHGLWNVRPIPKIGMSAFMKLRDCGTCSVIWTRNEGGLEHVSISPVKSNKLPSWEDMCKLKDIFFDDEEEVYQIHPPKSHYVNLSENCLHLWKPIPGEDKSGRVWPRT